MRKFWIALAAVVCICGARNVALADEASDGDSDDGWLKYSFTVPAVPDSFNKPGEGWGALVIQMNGPAGGTGLEGGYFVFNPYCPSQIAGKVDDLNSDFPNIQLGPGRYGLMQTGTDAGDGMNYGTMDIYIEYELGSGPPSITSAFWQNKLTSGGNTTWTFGANAPKNPDLMADSIPTPLVLPEPSVMLVMGAGGLLALMRRRGKLVS